MKKVLIINDDESRHVILGSNLAKRSDITMLKALTISQALEMFTAHPDVDLIAMDACMHGDTIDTEPLTREIRTRRNYKGHMVATSRDESFNDRLLAAGCNTRCDWSDNFYEIACALLKIPS